MRRLLLFALLLVGLARGDEPAVPTMREKLRMRILETLPPPRPAGPAKEDAESESPALHLEPMVVSEGKGVQELRKVLASEKQRLAAERFAPVKGGTIYKNERLELGSWWTPATGLQLMRIKW